MRIVEGGRSDGNRSIGREPPRTATPLESTDLRLPDRVIGHRLVQLVQSTTYYDLMESHGRIDDQPGMRVLADNIIEFEHHHGRVNVETRRDVVPGPVEKWLPGLAFRDTSPGISAVFVDIATLCHFLEDQFERGVVYKAREREKKLPAVVGADEHRGLLNGLTSRTRADLLSLKFALADMVEQCRFRSGKSLNAPPT